MRTTLTTLLALALLAGLAAAPTDAATIAQYNFDDGSAASSDTETLTTASSYTGTYYTGAIKSFSITDTVGSVALGSQMATSPVDYGSDGLAADTSTQEFSITIPTDVNVTFTSINFDYGFAETITNP